MWSLCEMQLKERWKLKGVLSVKVDLDEGKVDVEFNNDKVSLEKIKETIDDQGYDVK